MRHELAYAVAGVSSLAATLALGLATREGRMFPLDARAERALYGKGVPLAWFFTTSGYGWVLGATYVAALALVLALHRTSIELAALALTQLVSQGLLARFKRRFKRVRPTNWLIRRELDSSFPSGHATTAAVTFAGFALLGLRSSLPHDVKLGIAAVCALFVLGIGWSRIVLGAHYLSDVCGGYAFGATWLFALVALLEAFAV
jgi:membrane-associated phospholipid phosphatase